MAISFYHNPYGRGKHLVHGMFLPNLDELFLMCYFCSVFFFPSKTHKRFFMFYCIKKGAKPGSLVLYLLGT